MALEALFDFANERRCRFGDSSSRRFGRLLIGAIGTFQILRVSHWSFVLREHLGSCFFAFERHEESAILAQTRAALAEAEARATSALLEDDEDFYRSAWCIGIVEALKDRPTL